MAPKIHLAILVYNISTAKKGGREENHLCNDYENKNELGLPFFYA